MARSYGFRPRSPAERMRMAMLLTRAPARVEVTGDDGWIAACLAIAGRGVVLGSGCDVARARRALHRLGLPRPTSGPTEGRVDAFVELSGSRQPGRAPPVPVQGPSVAVVLRVSEAASLLPHALASLEAQALPPTVVVAATREPPGFASLRSRQGGLRLARGADLLAALWLAVEALRTSHVLILDEADLLLPGSLQVLAHALETTPGAVAARGDVIRFDAALGRVTAYLPAPTVPPEQALRALLHGWSGPLGALLVHRPALLRALEESGLHPNDCDLQVGVARSGGIVTVPVPTLLRRDRAGSPSVEPSPPGLVALERPPVDRAEAHAWADAWLRNERPVEARRLLAAWPGPGPAAEARVRGSAGLVPVPRPAADTWVVVDDGDVGALEATLARMPTSASLWVDVEVPRDPLPMVRRLWDGQFGVQERLRTWVTAPAPWHLRVSSDPDWAPPPLTDPGLLPDLAAPDAVLALAALMDWPLPGSGRGWRFRAVHPAARAAVVGRYALRRGRLVQASQAVAALRVLLPTWKAVEPFAEAVRARSDPRRTFELERAGAA